MKKKIIIFTVIMLGLFSYIQMQNNWIQVEKIEIIVEDAKLDGFTIAHLSDVHLPRNASNIKNIVSLVQNEKPDVILMTGDIIDRTANIQTSGLQELVEGLLSITQVYAVSGNHEQSSGNFEEWEQILLESGVKVLDDERVMLPNEIIIMGLKDCDVLMTSIEVEEDSFQILMVQRPMIWETAQLGLKPDLVLSGHAHGGQFRVPFIGGIVAPDQGLFPIFTSGLYESDKGHQTVISRGLGNSIMPVRLNNRPHLPIITLKYEN